MTNPIPHSTNLYLNHATRIHRSRQHRRLLFSEHRDMFGEPAWDILLSLFIMSERRETISVTGLAAWADLPLTTTQRWIRSMRHVGLLREEDDRFDARRRLVSLSDLAIDKMRLYLDKHYGGICRDRAPAALQ